MASYNELRKQMQNAVNNNESYVSEPETKAEPKTAASAFTKTQPSAQDQNMFDGQKDTDIAFQLYARICGVLCPLDRDVMVHNQSMLMGEMFEDDRYVPFESCVFIAKNLAKMMAMLTLDYKNVRNMFSEALEAEIKTDSMTAEQKLDYRSRTMSDQLLSPSDTFKMGLSVPDSITFGSFTELAKKGIDVVVNNKRLMADMESAAGKLTDDDRMICSVILSNHIYMLRIFSKNAVFINQLMGLMDAFEAEYGIK